MKSCLKIVFVAVFLFLYSCSFTEKKQVKVGDVELSATNELLFALDDSTVQSMEYLQFFQRNDSDILAFTNEYDNAIIFYDYATNKYIDRIHFDKEGNNGVGTLFSFHYLNKDSIYLYNIMMETLFLANNIGVVKEKYKLTVQRNLSKDSLFIAPLLFPRTNSPLVKIGDELLISGFFPNEFEGENSTNRPVISYFHCKEQTLRYSDSYPTMYHSGNWSGGFSFRNPCYTLSPQGEIVLSFAADPQIRVHSATETDFKEFYAGVGGENTIRPAEKKIDMKGFTREKEREHYIRNLNYGAIHYDQYRNVYYRLAFLPNPEIDINDEALRKPMEIIVLDDKFRIVGKKKMEDDLYWVNQCFVGPNGFHIQVKSVNDDELRFKTFIYEKSKNQ